jgi:RHH-type rel operon transcriptional repressor/antitoxin RelB
MTSIRLPEELNTELANLAAATKRSKSFFIREALEMYMEDLQDGYIALQRMNNPKAEYLTSEQLIASLKNK